MSGSAGGPAWEFVVSRADLHRRELRSSRAPDELAAGEVRFHVDAFALTSNNLTYAVTGDRFGYWHLFPAEDGWGRIPAWGVVTVEQSAAPELPAGERFTGMVPMSSHFVGRPRLTRDGFADVAAHRADVNPVYNRYVRVTGRADADLERDAALRPVYVLSFVLAHHLRASSWFGAERLLVTSASSKASLGLAHALGSSGLAVVGLTSPQHADLVRSSGLYHSVASYDRVAELAAGPPTALIDVSGNARVRSAVGARLGTSLVTTVHVGQTTWDAPADQLLGSAADAPPFFAPTEIERLVSEWGTVEFARRLDAGLRSFTEHSRPWLLADHRSGPTAMAPAFDDVAAGRIGPNRFIIVRP